MSTQTIEELVSDFCSTACRRDLYDFVNARTPIEFHSSETQTWGSETTFGKTHIYYSDLIDGEASLAHELLHAKSKLTGFKQYTYIVAPYPKQPFVKQLLGALDNELQHHWFYDEFLKLGFEAEQMYHWSDSEIEKLVSESIGQLHGAKTPIENYLLLYLPIIAPGGSLDAEGIERLKRKFEQQTPSRYWRRLKTIETNLKVFATSVDIDAGPTLKEIFISLGDYDHTWIGTDPQNPSSGFYIGQPFKLP